jgi:hypothetical protein
VGSVASHISFPGEVVGAIRISPASIGGRVVVVLEATVYLAGGEDKSPSPRAAATDGSSQRHPHSTLGVFAGGDIDTYLRDTAKAPRSQR